MEKMTEVPIEGDPLQVSAGEGAGGYPFARENASIGPHEAIDLDVIMDVPVTLAMEFGRTQISIKNLLKLNQGSIVELDRLAADPLDIFVNGTLVARGEVVVVNEKFGIRLTDIISLSERVKRLA
ncbi:flagellar motor switch protein FliN [Methylomicrobium sp. Wu6]|uniref:flagellar motor switch protein FliN n=1 Tax=Methylomicrobium sp. Wu6 TaxID=3107928 RepID=UPI002DD6B686|nr:flagellar motor switch protein FliN [Methylomicrobium sp. Wu6]MEC4747970.1 flagellar motor switch protein FliN [Methylomicrobium sp. Wu6]